MSALNQFTIPQLKKIVVYTGIGKYVKTSVTKDILVKQMDNFLHFDGYNFTIKDTKQQQMLKPQTLIITKKIRKIPKKEKEDFQNIKKLTEDNSDYVKNYMKKLKDLSQQIKNNPTTSEEMYPKKTRRKIFNIRPNIIKEELFEF